MVYVTLLKTILALQDDLRPSAFGSWIIIGGVLILVFLIGGFAWWLRHRRRP